MIDEAILIVFFIVIVLALGVGALCMDGDDTIQSHVGPEVKQENGQGGEPTMNKEFIYIIYVIILFVIVLAGFALNFVDEPPIVQVEFFVRCWDGETDE